MKHNKRKQHDIVTDEDDKVERLLKQSAKKFDKTFKKKVLPRLKRRIKTGELKEQ